MNDSEAKQLAAALLNFHCERKGSRHKCLGELRITHGSLEADCSICGVSREDLEESSNLVSGAIRACQSLGINYHGLCPSKKLALLRELSVS